VIALFPKVSRAVEQAVETHRRIPVQPVHNSRHIIRHCGFQQVMHMVAHDAQGIELKAKLVAAAANRVQQYLPTFKSGQPKFPVIAAGGDTTW
jgi:hypothetical protein